MRNKWWNWLSFKNITLTLTITVIIVIMMVYNGSYVKSLATKRSIDSQTTIAELFVNRIDSELTTAYDYLLTDTYGWSTSIIFNPSDTTDAALVDSRISKALQMDIAYSEGAIITYVYNSNNDSFIYANNDPLSKPFLDGIRSFAKDVYAASDKPKFLRSYPWENLLINNKYYFSRKMLYRGYVIGIVFDVKKLLTLTESDLSSTSSVVPVLCAMNGTPLDTDNLPSIKGISFTWNYSDYYYSGRNKKYIVSGFASPEGNYGVFMLVPNNWGIFSDAYTGPLIIILTVFIILYVILILYLNGRWILIPISKLETAMADVADGNEGIQLSEKASTEDFSRLNQSFNYMVNQIKALKIDQYEKMLELKNLDMERLRDQINPHLFLNSLNLIYQLEENHNPQVKDATLSLISCFRYFVRQKEPFVSISQELDYTNSYLKIQNLTYSNRIVLKREIPFSIESLYVPTMTFLEFVQNSIKYSLPFVESLVIDIKIKAENRNSVSTLIINVTDNGPGFDEITLDALNSHTSIADSSGRHHIGIENYYKRIKNHFGDYADLKISNGKDGGADIEIVLPNISDNSWQNINSLI